MTRSRCILGFLFTAALPAVLVTGCGGSPPNVEQSLNSDIVSRTACKEKPLPSHAEKTGDGAAVLVSLQECLQWSFDGQKLSILHVNAAQPCCAPERIVGWVTVYTTAPPQVEIQESMAKGGFPCPPCMCLFDLEYEVSWTAPITVQIRFFDPSLLADEQVLVDTIELKAGSRGTICVDRKRYPWL